ncbi:UDP-N-acetylmuramoyl-L-alanyl-D-glutamate--2,6-diaminopimelate ligase [Bifidobacterium thermophilum]|uniref:UDP-N-acetylmuramoyl-L-alanyl-D-glutamate--2, 6-diaminopimelate ligase n=1 Tax=Bifidobacterium thermophilum TaxID=33905 RepID=UPI0030A9676B
MALTLASAAQLLQQHHLLHEIIRGDRWTLDANEFEGSDTPFSAVTYDTRKVDDGTLLFCKGAFRPEYLDGIDARGLAAYVSETEFHDRTAAPGLIVSDVRKAMSLLSAEFYGRPQEQLTVVGITGTKGKTTTAYFTQAVLNAISGGKAALFSSVDNCVDGHTYVESDLTTPESLDAFRMMGEAVGHGMRYLVMEVSSQAYKVDRVYGLTFDVGVFLNISPDHISPIEHPSFEDYLWCKRQIVDNCRTLVLGADADHADLIRQHAEREKRKVVTFALHDEDKHTTPADVVASPADPAHMQYRIEADGTDLGLFSLAIDGDFNYANAAAALAIVHTLGLDTSSAALHAMEQVTIAGRMERFEDPSTHTVAIVDYAHNGVSVTALLDYVEERFGKRHPYITLITGSAGDKAYDRREEIVEAAQHRINRFIFTEEDTNTESTEDICKQMAGYVTDPQVLSGIILDRAQAIENAAAAAKSHAERLDVILAIGKGNERWIKRLNRHTPYEGDDAVLARVLG